MLIVFISF